MTTTGSTNVVHRVRPTDLIRLGLGGFTLLAPRTVLRVADAPDRATPRAVTRLLGARLLVQSAAGFLAPRRHVVLGDCIVELAHGATTVGLAATFPEYRRLALLSGTVAAAFAAADLADLSEAPTGDGR
jgi:hypothetical protein